MADNRDNQQQSGDPLWQLNDQNGKWYVYGIEYYVTLTDVVFCPWCGTKIQAEE